MIFAAGRERRNIVFVRQKGWRAGLWAIVNLRERDIILPEAASREVENMKAYYHLPGLFEFYDLYRAFLPLYREHREYFYDWCEIASISGAEVGSAAGTRSRKRRRR